MPKLDLAIERLRVALAKFREGPGYNEAQTWRDEVLHHYQPLFSLERIPNLTAEEFRSFLYYENNKHWIGLHRQVGRLTADMQALRKALQLLLDENQPLAPRFNQALSLVKGLGKAIATAVLLVAYPDRYGVWNNTSEYGLKTIGAWPEFGKGMSSGEKYAAINKVLNELAIALEIDLWTLDSLWWHIAREEEEGPQPSPPSDHRFPLERHLHDFLVANWEQTELGQEWHIYSEPDDELAGYEYPTAVGRIDILARHKEKPAWLVVELKRNRTADQALGQLLRYMGWIKRHLAQPGEEVHGVIIAAEAEKGLLYGLEALQDLNVSLLSYRVDFHLEQIPRP